MNLDRNIVIEASAGTGKTHTLVQTILRALFEKSIPMEALVAMTFTKKAAGEMKERIADELHKVLDGDSSEDLKVRAREALETIDRAAIGTIHSYAFSLLKRFPLAAGINPNATVDEKGIQTDDLFEKELPVWLRGQLQESKEWLKVLEQVPLKDVRTLARRLCEFDIPLDSIPLAGEGENATLAALTGLLKPFITRFRAQVLAEGFLSNDALLVLARDLVAGDPRVREILKNQIRLIFVDEFQDTDPLQGELVLFLCEQPGKQAKTWDKVKLEPGKLFIVGDPKQSIYRFRGADIAAYKRITEMVLAQGGERRSLDESYRSHAQIVQCVNAAFSVLMKEKAPVSPAYQALVPRRSRDLPEHQDVEVRLASSEEDQSSEDALKREADDVAIWINAAWGQRPIFDAKKNELRSMLFKDIALIFRSGPAMPAFIEALRQRDIPFLVEAERFFYRAPEVTDVLNLLRVVENANDHTALAGLLRSPLGGFTDKDVVAIKQAGWKAVTPAKAGAQSQTPLDSGFRRNDNKNHAATFFELIKGLQKRARREPLKSILNHVYEDTFLMELAARSYHKDQTMANLLKLKRLMETFAEEGETTLAGLLAKIDRFMENDKLEGEYPLADETYDAVRLMTVHKAKGLDFPVVWLPGLHRGKGGSRGKEFGAHYDWSSGTLAISLNKEIQSRDWDAWEEDVKLRDSAEDLRVLYVAMTRAKERLILSGGTNLKRPSKDAYLNQLAGAWKLDLEDPRAGVFTAGESTLSIHLIDSSKVSSTTDARQGGGEWLNKIKPSELAERWKKQETEFEEGMETRRILTPSSLQHAALGMRHAEEGFLNEELPSPAPRVPRPALLGSLVHKFLESWDFSCEKCDMPAKLRHVANSYFASEGLLKEPFPDPKVGDKTSNPPELVEIVEEAQRLLADFIGSEAEEEIKTSTIIGREVPFFYNVGEALMRGFIDILYRTSNGKLIIGDYKTDKEHDDSKYAAQGAAYTEAVSRALGEKAIFKTIYIRQPDRQPSPTKR